MHVHTHTHTNMEVTCFYSQGTIQAVKQLDRELTDVYTLVVTATRTDNSNYQSQALVSSYIFSIIVQIHIKVISLNISSYGTLL